MNVLAHGWHGGGPGPWALFFPLIWAVIIIGAIVLLRRTVWRRHGPWIGPGGPAGGGPSPIAELGRRFAAGEIEEDEYRRRLAVLKEQFGTYGHGGYGKGHGPGQGGAGPAPRDKGPRGKGRFDK